MPASGVLVGIFQAVAILPGISRSGFTIGGGLLLKLDKDKAVRFSFILGFVAIAGAAVLKIKDIAGLSGQIPIGVLLTAFAASFVSSYFALKLILFVVRVRKLKVFGFYCFAVAILALIFLA